MAVETAAQCDWLSLLTDSSIIPASAFVAICLFIIRELLDGYRKRKARKNEIRALKQIFARECQLAWYINDKIKDICEEFVPFEEGSLDACPLGFNVYKTTAGKTRYSVFENGKEQHGGMLTEPSVATFERYTYDVSKLDSVFYEKVSSAFEAVTELKHFYDSLVDNEDTARINGIDTILLGFSGYALRNMEWIEHNLKDLYQYCTDEELTQGLLR